MRTFPSMRKPVPRASVDRDDVPGAAAAATPTTTKPSSSLIISAGRLEDRS
ncbi:MAG: hypothetical protein AAF399_09610 [Bacteroidota bacterium]